MVRTRSGMRDENLFCSLLGRPEIEPWFTRDVWSYAEMYRWPNENDDLHGEAMALKFFLLEKGIAATPYLVSACEANRGRFRTPVREYHIATNEELNQALAEFVLAGENPTGDKL